MAVSTGRSAVGRFVVERATGDGANTPQQQVAKSGCLPRELTAAERVALKAMVTLAPNFVSYRRARQSYGASSSR